MRLISVMVIACMLIGCSNTFNKIRFKASYEITKISIDHKFNKEDFVLPEGTKLGKDYKEFILLNKVEYASQKYSKGSGLNYPSEILERKTGNCQSFMVLAISYYGFDNLEYVGYLGNKEGKFHVIAIFKNGIVISNKYMILDIDPKKHFYSRYPYFKKILPNEID